MEMFFAQQREVRRNIMRMVGELKAGGDRTLIESKLNEELHKLAPFAVEVKNPVFH